MSLGLNYKLVTLTFGGSKHQFLTHTLSTCISSWRARSVHTSVSYAHDQNVLKALFKFGFFTLMLSIRGRNCCICVCWRIRSAKASFPDPYAQGTHRSPWCVCSDCFEGTALLKIRLSLQRLLWCKNNIRAIKNLILGQL